MDNNPCASQLETAVQHFVNEVSKTRQNSEYAAREISWGVFDHSQLEDISSLLVDLIPPASGLSSVADMLQLSTAAGYNLSNDACAINRHSETDNDSSYDDDWQHLETAMHQHSQKMTEAILEGIEHAKVRLELIKGRSLFSRSRVRKVDVEHRAVAVNPGEAGFLESYRDVFERGRVLDEENEAISNKKLLECYIQHRPQVGNLSEYTSEMHSNTLRYFLFLHSQTLLSSLGNELLNLLTFLDDCYSRPKRLLIPPFFHPKYWVERFVHLGGTQQKSTSQDAEKQTNVELGPGFYSPKNPDHLPPSSLMETIGDYIPIIAFLHDSQNFYFRHRFLWSLFAILLSMARTAGSSTFLLLGRVLGTLASMITSYIIWYVVDEKTPGILVFLWLWFIVLGYLFVKFPSLFSIWFVALIASIVMIANELQVRKLGEAAVLASGQAVYAPYIIFPYRLAFVTLGVVTGYFWTIFPYPLSEHSELRENTAKTMYGLACYYMCIQQTVLAHLHGNFGDIKDKTSPGFHLQAARRRIFHKYQALNTSTKTGYQFLDWEFGSYMTLISYVSRDMKASKATSSWWANDPTGTAQAHLIPKGITTRMIILHSALSRAHPLPPKLTEIEIPHMGEFLTRDVPADAGFAAAALIHSVTWYLIRDVNRLTQ
ncbi:fusaric acid resistance protein-like domain-containing protein [Trichoderma breve]|uniref:Fusaric acid resistance protein-like domain-containing protein n=1 Tax=Trichoderma breve TaxID=2034170 RepID=A0A9W9E383_9HYPO|nr:fusaric acid resistance protein-like domain-containing protein [Trichoderma breve]KAJ4857298.1 fusaric acid resistance protein-like domain-containing protein [Trichoderma breve]